MGTVKFEMDSEGLKALSIFTAQLVRECIAFNASPVGGYMVVSLTGH